MRALIVVCFFNFFITSHLWAQSSKPMSLKEVVDQALKKAETVPLQEARTSQAEEKVSQAKAGMLPKIGVLGTYMRQDTSNGTTSATTQPDQSNVRFNLAQPLFKGFGEYAEMRAVRGDFETQKALIAQARLNVYADAGQSFYNILLAEQDLKDLRDILDLTDQRVQDIGSRTKIGRSRRSELLTAQSQTYTLKTQIKAAQSAVEQARDGFSLVTGLPRTTVLTDLGHDLPAQVGSLESYLKQIDSRPDLLAFKEQVRAGEEQVSVAKSGHWPSLDLGGNYYLKRSGALEGVNWDLGLTLTIPIYEGGIISSQVSEASARVRERELLLFQARRLAERNIRVAHENVQSGISQLISLKEGLQIAEKNYQEQSRDYRYGLSTNLEVLSALNAFQETKRALDRTRFQILASWVTLQASIGKLP